MNKSEELIHQYEVCRAKISALKLERSNLINECDKIDAVDFNGLPMTVGELCLSSLWEDDGRDSYHEAVEEFACEHCKKSFAIKRGPLAEARKEFGNIKRRLTYLGKKLIKESAK